jgi:hypothetical protein
VPQAAVFAGVRIITGSLVTLVLEYVNVAVSDDVAEPFASTLVGDAVKLAAVTSLGVELSWTKVKELVPPVAASVRVTVQKPTVSLGKYVNVAVPDELVVSDVELSELFAAQTPLGLELTEAVTASLLTSEFDGLVTVTPIVTGLPASGMS